MGNSDEPGHGQLARSLAASRQPANAETCSVVATSVVEYTPGWHGFQRKVRLMAIVEADFDNEKELEHWVKAEFSAFIPSSIVLDGFSVSTPSGNPTIQ